MTSQRPWIDGLPTRLRIGERLGGGATSTVWRARDLLTGDDVVVKVLDAAHASGRLEREARALARLRGVPGIVVVHELGRSADGTGWIVVDLAPGGSLRDRIGDGHPSGPLDAVAARRVTAALAAALDAAHSRSVVHGDVSPANVLFGHDDAALLADFGAADLDGTSDPVRQGLTPAYAAPERRRGAAASTAGDVYSLAATVSAACGDPDGDLASLWADCLAEQPAHRPSAAQVVAALVGTVDGPGVEPGPGGRRWPVRGRPPRR